VTGEIFAEAQLLKLAADVTLTLIDEGKVEHIAGCEEVFSAGQGLPPTSAGGGAFPQTSVTPTVGSSWDPNDKAALPGRGRGHLKGANSRVAR